MQQETLPPPVAVSFAITRECNLKCKHCYSNATDSPHPEELNTSETKAIITEIAEAGTRFLLFDGGEPLMRSDIYELITYAKDAGLQPMMFTNAAFLSTEAVDKLNRAGILLVSISIHGANSKTHDTFCGREGSWDRAVAGIRNAATGGLRFHVNTCVSHNNLSQLDAIATLARDSGAEGFDVFDMSPVGRGKANQTLALTLQERQSLVTHIIERQLDEDLVNYHCIGIPQYLVQVEKTVVGDDNKRRYSRLCCSAGVYFCAVFYEGSVYPCTLLQKRAGNVREKSFEEIWQGSEVFKTLRLRDKLEGKCKLCAYRRICGGARCWVYDKTGSLTKQDESCWFVKDELQRFSVDHRDKCEYCGKKLLANCEVCGAAICEEHLLRCPVCHIVFCHPDGKGCFLRHEC